MVQYRWNSHGPLLRVGFWVLLVWALCLMDLSADGIGKVYEGYPVLLTFLALRDFLLVLPAAALWDAILPSASLSERGFVAPESGKLTLRWAEVKRMQAGQVDYGEGKEYELLLDKRATDNPARIAVPLTADDDHWAVFRRFTADAAAWASANGAEVSPTVRAFLAREPNAWDEGRQAVRGDPARLFGPVLILLFSPLLPLVCGVVITLCAALGGPLAGWRLVQCIAAAACAAAGASAYALAVRRSRRFGWALAAAFVLWAVCLSLWAMPTGWDSGITRVELFPPLLLAALWPMGRFLFAQQDVRASFSK